MKMWELALTGVLFMIGMELSGSLITMTGLGKK